MTDFKFNTPTEALADAWASIDGKVEKFRAGKDVDTFEDEPGGYYSGYMEDAAELRKRLKKRGFLITKLIVPRRTRR